MSDIETLAYSWRQELDADLLGSILSINACISYERLDFSTTLVGIGLFFDGMDVMDRAVALLKTGDENSLQVGSHPPATMRKQHLRDSLPRVAGDDPAKVQEVRAAIEMGDVQAEIVRLLWDRTRPTLLDLRRRGVPAAPTWRTIPKESVAS